MKKPVIELHCHVFAMGPASKVILGERIRTNKFAKFFLKQFGYTPDRTPDEADAFYAAELARKVRESELIDYAVAIALDAIYDSNGKIDIAKTDFAMPNDYVRDVCRRHPELLYGASVNPARADAIDELERVKADGAILIKWVANSMDFDPSEKRFIPFYRKMAELDLKLLSHTGYEHTIRVTDQMFGDPRKLVTPLNEGVTCIAAHAGTSGHTHPVEFFDDYVKMLREYPNLYGELSAICTPSRFGYAKKMIEIDGFFDKHMQALDYPVTPMPLLFINRLGIKKATQLNRIKNPFDRDIKTKLALGFPDSILTKAADMFNIHELPRH